MPKAHNISNKQILLFLIVIGVLIRLIVLISNQSLLHDEALLSWNIISKTHGELLSKLDYGQSAPVGFLLLIKSLSLMSIQEWMLRLLPFLASVGSLFLFWHISKKLFTGPALFLCFALMVFCGPHISYAAEVKQYSTDVFFSCLMLYLYLSGLAKRQYFFFVFIAATSIWFSNPIVFVLAAIGLFYLAEQKNWTKTIVMSCTWLLSFALYYYFILRHDLQDDYLQDYHKTYFMPFDLLKPDSWSWYLNSYFGLLRNPGGILFKYLAGSIVLFGLLSQVIKKSFINLIWAFPLCLAFLASGLELYSTIPRLMLFSLPFVFVLIGYGIEAIRLEFLSRLPNPWPLYGTYGLLFLLLLQPILDSVHKMRKPDQIEHCRPLMQHLSQQIASDDHLYIYQGAIPHYLYYAERFPSLKLVGHTKGISPWEDWKKDLNTALLKGTRTWIVFSHYKSGKHKAGDHILYTEYLRDLGQVQMMFDSEGAVLYEFKQ